MRIGARGKVGYLTGAKTQPAPTSAEYEGWVTDNEKVKSWLIDSMEQSFMNRYIRLPTAKDVWDAVAKTFYDDSDETRIFELNKKCFGAKQNGRSLPVYYNELVSMFQEIDQRTASQADTVEGVVLMTSSMARMRVHMFLCGLDSEYDQVRGEILRKEPKYDLEQSYAYVRKVQSERQVMGHSTESSALATQRRQGPPPGFSNPSNKAGSSIVQRPFNKAGSSTTYSCTHCGETGHIKNRCYEIVGYPEWWDFSKKPRKKIGKAAVATTEDEHPSTGASANVAQTGIVGKAFVSPALSTNDTWIIDTGATDHMTNNPKSVKNFNSSSQAVISTADGSLTPVIGEGSVVLSDTLTLDSVLVVPSLSHNLLSVSQITLLLTCIVTF